MNQRRYAVWTRLNWGLWVISYETDSEEALLAYWNTVRTFPSLTHYEVQDRANGDPAPTNDS